jgi:hypothetical protein
VATEHCIFSSSVADDRFSICVLVAPFSAASAAVTPALAIDVVAAFPLEFAMGQYNMFSNSSQPLSSES